MNSAYRLLLDRKIAHVKVGNKYLIPKKAILNFLDNQCYNAC